MDSISSPVTQQKDRGIGKKEPNEAEQGIGLLKMSEKREYVSEI